MNAATDSPIDNACLRDLLVATFARARLRSPLRCWFPASEALVVYDEVERICRRIVREVNGDWADPSVDTLRQLFERLMELAATDWHVSRRCMKEVLRHLLPVAATVGLARCLTDSLPDE